MGDRCMLRSPSRLGGIVEFQARSEQMSLNRQTEKAGPCTRPLRHIGVPFHSQSMLGGL